jgi:hypothetical protein
MSLGLESEKRLWWGTHGAVFRSLDYFSLEIKVAWIRVARRFIFIPKNLGKLLDDVIF